jgi:hypothetical protein
MSQLQQQMQKLQMEMQLPAGSPDEDQGTGERSHP